jgi:hypothetical protein
VFEQTLKTQFAKDFVHVTVEEDVRLVRVRIEDGVYEQEGEALLSIEQAKDLRDTLARAVDEVRE